MLLCLYEELYGDYSLVKMPVHLKFNLTSFNYKTKHQVSPE